MKSVAIILVLLSAALLNANVFFVSNYTQMCIKGLGADSSDYNVCDSLVESPSMFELLEGGNMFTHTAPDMKSTYFMSDVEYDDSTGVMTANAISSAGNSYVFAFAAKNKKVVAVGTRPNGKKYMIIFFASNVFTK